MSISQVRRLGMLLGIVVFAVLQGCASGPTIRADGNPDLDFSKYRTFAFFNPLATDKGQYASILTTRLKQATRRELEARGYVYDEAHPDLLVNFFANKQEKQYVSSTPSATPYFGYRAGYYDPWAGWGATYGTPDVQTYYKTEGTLTIDLVDAAVRQLAWQGSASGTITDKVRENVGAAVDAVVPKIFAKYPYTASR
jgi:Domain of unknown function (DUF4136)